MLRDAIIDVTGAYRYALTRHWGPGPLVTFIGLNPSTADATVDDPTVRRCLGFAQAWGFGSLCLVNLFAFRSTGPMALRLAVDPIGPDNDQQIRVAAIRAGRIVAAWGTHGGFRDRDQDVMLLLRDLPLYCLGVTGVGLPRHPLYLPSSARCSPYIGRS